MLRRAVLPLALLLTTLAAQQPAKELQKTLDEQLLASLLPRVASTEAADVAWGAHLIGHYRLAGATKELREALQSWRKRDGEAARQVRLHLIDALLTLETKLPADEFVFLLDDPLTRVPAFLCAALDVQGNAELLDVVAALRTPSRFASGLNRGQQQCDQDSDDGNDDQ